MASLFFSLIVLLFLFLCVFFRGEIGTQFRVRIDRAQVFGSGGATSAGLVVRSAHDQRCGAGGYGVDGPILRRVRGARTEEVTKRGADRGGGYQSENEREGGKGGRTKGGAGGGERERGRGRGGEVGVKEIEREKERVQGKMARRRRDESERR